MYKWSLCLAYKQVPALGRQIIYISLLPGLSQEEAKMSKKNYQLKVVQYLNEN